MPQSHISQYVLCKLCLKVNQTILSAKKESMDVFFFSSARCVLE